MSERRPVAPALITASGDMADVTLGTSWRRPPTRRALPIAVPMALSYYVLVALSSNLSCV